MATIILSKTCLQKKVTNLAMLEVGDPPPQGKEPWLEDQLGERVDHFKANYRSKYGHEWRDPSVSNGQRCAWLGVK